MVCQSGILRAASPVAKVCWLNQILDKISCNAIPSVLFSVIGITLSMALCLAAAEAVIRLKNRSMNNYDIEMWRYARELKSQKAPMRRWISTMFDRNPHSCKKWISGLTIGVCGAVRWRRYSRTNGASCFSEAP